jgi:hypothetical protein
VASDNERKPGNWRGNLLVVAAVFAGICIYQVSLIAESGSGAVVGAVLFGACGLLALLRARRRV